MDTYQVINGLVNGEPGMFAITTCEEPEADGWYYLKPEDANGTGPFNTEELAKQAARNYSI